MFAAQLAPLLAKVARHVVAYPQLPSRSEPLAAYHAHSGGAAAHAASDFVRHDSVHVVVPMRSQ